MGAMLQSAGAQAEVLLTGLQETVYTVGVKTTIDIPDELYRQVKAKSALQGKRIREVTIELYRRWLSEDTETAEEDPVAWLREWLRLADEALKSAPDGPSARELLEEGRNRLEGAR